MADFNVNVQSYDIEVCHRLGKSDTKSFVKRWKKASVNIKKLSNNNSNAKYM